MIKDSINKGWFNEKVIMESLLSFKEQGQMVYLLTLH